VDAYIKAGHRVVVIDNLSKGFRKNVHSKATFYKADITDLALMEKIFKKEKPEVVNHHAAIAEVVLSMRDPIPTLTTNVLGTANVLLAFGHHGRGGAKRKFIFASTGGAIYGEPKKIPADESTSAAPLSPYGLSKLLGEETIAFYARQYGFTYLIFRYPNVYGPRQNPRGEAGVVAIFGGLIKSGKQPTIFGDGTKSRDYTFVHDIVHANMLALKKGKNDTINLGWGKTITDRQVFDAIARIFAFPEKPIYLPFRAGEVYRISIDAKKATRVLGWKPKTQFEKGVREAVEGIK